MDCCSNVLIVGAGPSGLVCALSLTKSGIPVRLIEKRTHRGSFSKATGVSLGTIRALKWMGLSKDITNIMTPMRRFIFYEDNNLISDISIPLIGNNEPPAYLFPQLDLEIIIERELNQLGIFVEYGSTVEKIDNNQQQYVNAEIRRFDGEISAMQAKWIIGADGAHSTVRDLCGFEFIGREYPEEWSVAEIETSEWSNEIQAKLHLGSNGVGLFLSNPKADIIQGILNAPNVGDVLAEMFPNAKLNYQRSFKVSLKRVLRPRKNRVWVIGDAAHVQSPVGGQGLNLAVADAIILSNWLYSREVYAETYLASLAKRTLWFTDFDYKMLATKSYVLRMLRNKYWAVASRFPSISRWFFKSISGINDYKGIIEDKSV
jgi:2-polyprenyl-6-methoxyphenol hydroxylase-like FAD-dependent oxidoreductase